MKNRLACVFGCSVILLAVGCAFPRLGPATPPPVSTPLPQLTPTIPPPVTETPNPENAIPHLSPGTLLTLSRIYMVSTNNGWAIGTAETEKNAHILHTTDGGLTWKDVTPPEPLDTSGTKDAIAYFADDSNLWVSYSILQTSLSNPATQAVIWASHDGGKTWTASQPLDASQGFESYQPGLLHFSDATHGWFMAHVGVGMSHDYVFFYSTRDAGNTWTRLADPYNESSFPQVCCKYDMVFTDATHGWLAGNTHGVMPGIFFYQTADAGQTWSLVNLPAPAAYPNLFTTQDFACGTYEIQFVDARRGFVGVECFSQVNTPNLGWLYVTADGEGTWAPEDVPQAQGLFQFLNPGQGWYVADKVYQTTDGGRHWTPGATVTWTGVPDFVDSLNGWLVASKENALALVRSNDAGASWTLLKPVVAP